MPDNLRSAVSKSHRYEPDINPSYRDLAEHYGVAVVPARARKPRDKAKAEVGVQVVERWILAALRNRQFFSLDELNSAIALLLEQLNRRPFRKLPGSRQSAFEALDRPALRPLPVQPYVYAEWKKARVHIDYHVEVDGHYYSVPYQLVKKQLEVRLTARTVECFHANQRVASHLRSPHKGRHSTQTEHMPKGNDQVNGYLLLATSCDGTLATTATPSTVRVVCNNTLTIALDGTSRAIKVPHNTRFDPQAVKKQLGIAVSQWDDFMYRMRALAERKVQWHEALGFFMGVLCETSPTGALPEVLPNERALRKAQELYEGRGRGSQLDSARGTAWGLLNAVTEYVDHERRARSNEYRMDSTWFGQGAQIKQRALDAALQLAA